MKDALGRKIDYLRISVTDKCNLRCKYCMPEEGITHLNHDEILTIDETLKIVEIFKDLGIKKVRLTGGEPL
ncbi:MAG: radical SAM protein, partial [Finegoldia magna]|nr:radical SAM protein [Finegoldia magna]